MSEIPDDPRCDPRPFGYTLGNFAKLIKSVFPAPPYSGTVRIQRPVLRDHADAGLFDVIQTFMRVRHDHVFDSDGGGCLGRSSALVFGILSLPVALAFDTDSYFTECFGHIGIGEALGHSGESTFTGLTISLILI